MATQSDDAQELPIYAVRISARARADIGDAVAWLAENADTRSATEWEDSLFDEIATLATLPKRCSVAEESQIFSEEVRQLIYRRRTSAVAYRVLYVVRELADDAPHVRIVHIRHGARRAITRREAQEIEADTE